jgi:hypothetical protein
MVNIVTKIRNYVVAAGAAVLFLSAGGAVWAACYLAQHDDVICARGGGPIDPTAGGQGPLVIIDDPSPQPGVYIPIPQPVIPGVPGTPGTPEIPCTPVAANPPPSPPPPPVSQPQQPPGPTTPPTTPPPVAGGSCTTKASVCSCSSASALVISWEAPSFANAAPSKQFCTYNDLGNQHACGSNGAYYNAIGPGIRISCNSSALASIGVTNGAKTCVTKAQLDSVYPGILANYQKTANKVINAAAANGHPICSQCLKNELVSAAYRGDLNPKTHPGLVSAIESGNYAKAAVAAQGGDWSNAANRKQDMINALNDAAAHPCSG